MNIDSDFELLKCNLNRFIKTCKQSQKQETTRGLNLREINGTFKGFTIKANFGSGNIIKRPSLAFLKDGNVVSNGIYPIIVFIPEYNELIVCKGVSYDYKAKMQWKKIRNEEKLYNETKYADERGKFSYLRSVYSIENINDDTIKYIQRDIENIIEDYPKNTE